MDMALWLSLVGFVFAMSYTPGPNNLMVMSSSALFGVRRTLPHWLGMNVGFNVMLVAAVFGLGELVLRFPVALVVVKAGGSLWLAWMAWQYAVAALNPLPAAARSAGQTRTRPFRTYEAALFQWVNPKAMMMSVSAAGAYVALADTAPERAAIMVGTFLCFGAPAGLAWMFAGGTLKRFMGDPRWARILNAAIAGIILLTIALILLG
ncbi:LysE family translocator [Maricaulis sp.]|uniref:LysE family translocator n=1 Tax=Maricaulis sp. TaxID=1486257 RepID=UPI00262ADC4D|nr:LysE family translocator [Maricaulis sp.]